MKNIIYEKKVYESLHNVEDGHSIPLRESTGSIYTSQW